MSAVNPATYRRYLFLAWVAFILRGMFYCVALPMWEGYDEWAHFAYIETIAEHGRPPYRHEPISDELCASLELVPLPYHFRGWPTPHSTHDQFWELSPDERLRRQQRLYDLPTRNEGENRRCGFQYEAQQPPLYYSLLAPFYVLIRECSLPTRVLLLRLVSMLIASTVVPLGFAIANELFWDARVSALIATFLAALPGLMVDVSRVGNDCLAIAVTSALVLSSLRTLSDYRSSASWTVLGLLLGCGLLTKAYVLVFLPIVLLLPVLRSIKGSEKVTGKRAILVGLVAVSIAAAVSGWWYWKAWRLTGSLSGEQVDAATAHLSLATKIAAIGCVDWITALDTLAFTHIWVGGWSFVVVRSWMYRVIEISAIVSAVGVLVAFFRVLTRVRRMRMFERFGGQVVVVAMVYLLFCGAAAYHSLVVFLTKGVSTALGWYLYPVIAAEAILFALGASALVGKRGMQSCLTITVMFAVTLDVYTMNFVLIPYYTGLIRHNAAGSLSAFYPRFVEQIGGIGEVLVRLSINEPLLNPAIVAALWCLYLCSALGLLAQAIFVVTRAKMGERQEH